ncbi:PcfJ domain-containing protein, partial [Clostridium cochlearium]|uniref:PcfJ domain-containing protein n=1 Tax=Clostridium cochlearium TaxID=1494 RepID=UPI00241DDF38
VENIINMDSYSIKDIFNLSGKKFNDILKLNKSYIPRLQKLNVNVSELKILQYAYKKNIHITDDQIEFIYKNQINPSGLMEISKYSNLNKCIKYLKKQSKIEDKKISNVYIGWKDYIKNCKLMQYDLTNEFILFPKNLKREHDKVMKLVKVENTKKLNRLIEQKHEILSKLYEFEYKDFFIAVAKNADEIIKEGQNLHHCVGGISYLEGMALGNNNIIFIRKKQEPSKSFYTMEIQTSRNKIIQCRGKTNDDMTPEVEEFVEKFKNKKLNKIHRNKAV